MYGAKNKNKNPTKNFKKRTEEKSLSTYERKYANDDIDSKASSGLSEEVWYGAHEHNCCGNRCG